MLERQDGSRISKCVFCADSVDNEQGNLAYRVALPPAGDRGASQPPAWLHECFIEPASNLLIEVHAQLSRAVRAPQVAVHKQGERAHLLPAPPKAS